MVRIAETTETMGGGRIIIPPSAREKLASYQCIVESVGLPAICEDKKCQRPTHLFERSVAGKRPIAFHPVHPSIRIGAWVLVRPRSFVPISDTDPRYFVRQDDVECVFRVA